MSDFSHRKCVHELFDDQAVKRGDAIAIVDGLRKISYRELNARADQLANHLIAFGVKPGAHIAVSFTRSIELVAAELAILKCGAAYVPLDPNTPAEWQAFIVRDSNASVVLAVKDSRIPDGLGAPRIDIDAPPAADHRARDVGVQMSNETSAYVMYTSGSTGRPKGVAVPHRAVTQLVLRSGFARLSECDCVAFIANPAFDPSTMEVWAPLLHGGRLIVIDQATLLSPARLSQLLELERVNVLHLTSGLFGRHAAALGDAFHRLRYLFVGGDVVDPRAVAFVMRESRPKHLIHAYGPTETTLFAAVYEVTQIPDEPERLPIGRAIKGASIYILDEHGEPVPVGSPGEIHVGGAGVAMGYWNLPDLTAERFLPDPFCGHFGARMYKTGDVGRRLPDENVEFLGRNDSQVKIRGFRIELGLVESRLREHPLIGEAVVVAHEDGSGERTMAAYYTTTTTQPPLDPDDIRSFLLQRLPEYMVPATYECRREIPLTANGKVDRAAFGTSSRAKTDGRPRSMSADAKSDGDNPGAATAAISTALPELENVIERIWCACHGTAVANHHQHFFAELGGNSLSIMRICWELSAALGTKIPLTFFFQYPTIHELAEALCEPKTQDPMRNEQRAAVRQRALRHATTQRTKRD